MVAHVGGLMNPLPTVTTLPEILRGMGYDTWMFSGGSWAERSGLARGFNHFFSHRSFFASPGVGWGGRVLRVLQNTFGSALRPFLLAVFLRDTHAGYAVPEKFRRWAKTRSLKNIQPDIYYTGPDPGWTEADCQEINDRYDESVLYEDYVTHQMIAWLDANGFMENTIIIFCGDHGEALCDRWFQDRYLFEHTSVLYDEMIRVPLVVWGPGFSTQEITGPVELRSLYKLILDIAQNRQVQSETMVSPYTLSWTTYPKYIATVWQQRKPGYDNPYLFSAKLAVRSSEWKYIKVDRVGEELYDLQKDPGETTNTFDPQHTEVLKMYEFLRGVGSEELHSGA
jgi:arylsulfatase A-like enzyme